MPKGHDIVKPNILICGQTGAGKSSIVNFIFGRYAALTGENTEPCTKGILFCPGEGVNFYDSEGYEIGKTSGYKKIMFDFLEKKRKLSPDSVHIVWYAVSGAGKRLTPFDVELIRKIRDSGFHVCILVTKIDEMDMGQMNEMSRDIAREFSGVEQFKLSVKKTAVQQYCDWKKLKERTNQIQSEVQSRLVHLKSYMKGMENEDEFNRKKNDVGSKLGKKKTGPIAQIWNTVQSLWNYVISDKVAWYKKIMPLGALVYLVSPIDAAPDLIPVLGLLDDVAVISLAAGMLGSILDDFNKQQKTGAVK